MAAILEEMGRALLPGPFASTVLLAGTTLNAAASDRLKQTHLAASCGGEIRATVADLDRSASWHRESGPIAGEPGSGGTELTTAKLFVGDAAAADFIIVAARAGDARELVLLLVPRETRGVQIMLTPGVDLTRRLYRVVFDHVRVPPDLLVARGAA